MSAASPAWLQILLSALGMLGGTGGVVAAAMVLVQRRKLKADTADVLTDTALTLVKPLRERVAELETEADDARRKVAATNGELDRLKDSVRDLTRMLLRLRTEILSPDADLARLRDLVRSAPGDLNRRG
ncbi:hypothetical protein ACQEVC_45440 [Plantactinospora sp. CA-294935]|uniref:hypothetical protein n=1 Tax=Plantactinospora sp. CA-294935 TaxID=3240012 RepID=UPI003D90F4E2